MHPADDRHLSEEQLSLLQDGDPLPPPVQAHFAACPDCRQRLAALDEILMGLRQQPPAAPPHPWPTLDTLLTHEASPRTRWWLPALAAALASLAVYLYVRPSAQQDRNTSAAALLTRAANTEPVVIPAQTLAFRQRERIRLRPALLTQESAALADLRTLFVAAQYSWQEPLSARSFAAWRRQLAHPRDSVTVIHSGPSPAYRVRTDNPGGLLQSATLTLLTPDLHPSVATFDFQSQPTLEVTTATSAPPAPQLPAAAPEQPATPADTLHVLAALNELGADVGEPVTIAPDAAHRTIVVNAANVSPARQQQIAQALRPLRRVTLSLRRAPNDAPTPPTDAPHTSFSASLPHAIRQRLEQALGGAAALDAVTNDALETSATIIARAHALQLLTTSIPPASEAALGSADRQVLTTLRTRHTVALQQLITTLTARLQPLLLSPGPPVSPGVAPPLVTAAQELDRTLNRLLAGAYTQAEGEQMLAALPGQVDRLRAAIIGIAPQ